MHQFQQFGRLRSLGSTLAGAVAALSLGAGVLALAPQAARAQAAPGDTFTSLYSFGGTVSDGVNPAGGLVLGPSGALYGSTPLGGANGDGSIYTITSSGTEAALYSFGTAANDGNNPYNSLVLGSDGNFYGTSSTGGANNYGTVFQITPSGTLTTLYSFTGGADGMTPYGALVFGADGALYGTTAGNDSSQYGSIFKITTTGTFTTLYTFSGTDGNYPYNGLTLGPDGNFYGTTAFGGASGDGNAFQITPAGTLTTIFTFTGGADGDIPYSGLTLGADGNLYGLTYAGGTNNTGIAYKLTTTGALTPLYSFSASGSGNTDGAEPAEPLILGTDGNFYGTADSGGGGGSGTVFQLTPAGTLSTLYTFSADSGSGNADGSEPFGALVEAGNGALYGTTRYGGASEDGTVFSLTVPSLAPAPTGSGVRFDFDGDGHADLFWRNTASGDLSIWNMNDQQVLSYGDAFAGPAPSSNWLPVATVDVNGDGFPDIIWWNSGTGELSCWLMQYNRPQNCLGDFNRVSDTDWKPVAAADVTDHTNHTPTAWELVFQNTSTGDISRWVMSGLNVTAFGGTIATLGPNTPWQISGAPDIDGDGLSDLLFWNNQTGEVSYWGMNLPNSQVRSVNPAFTSLTDLDWHLIGSEDTNGDGHPDLVWWNASTGELSRWLLNGATVTQFGDDTATVPDTTWQPIALR